jgi:hypothetical protein
LERLLINLGSDQDPQRFPTNIEEEADSSFEHEEEEEKPPKRHAEDNKLSNTFASQTPKEVIQESIDEREMDSYIRTIRTGSLGIGSGVASPIEMEYQTDMIDIVKPEVFDPMHPGLANLSPT